MIIRFKNKSWIGINVDEDLITIFMEDQPKKLHFFDESIGRLAKMNCYVI